MQSVVLPLSSKSRSMAVHHWGKNDRVVCEINRKVLIGMRFRTLCKTLLPLACFAFPAVANAQQPVQPAGVALNRFDPSFAGDRMFGVASPFVAGELTPHVALIADYAHNPLVLRREGDDSKIGGIVEHQLYGHLNGTFALFRRFAINVDVPVALYQAGTDPSGGGQTFGSPTATQFGDLRLGARLRILGDYHDAFQLGIGGHIWLPTGTENSFVSDERVRGMPQLLLGGLKDRFLWSATLGAEFRPSQTYAGVAQGKMFRWGAGVGYQFGESRAFQLNLESTGGLVLEEVTARTTNVEVLLGARYRFAKNFEVGIGAGPGLTSGIGTPDLRGVFMLAYTPAQVKAVPVPPSPPDRDKDGVLDPDDACIDVAGVKTSDVKTNGCPPPPPDRDKDGIVDAKDACVDVPGVASDDAKKNGCPADRDNDTIIDPDDACPDVAGVKTSDPKTHGCPPDADGDGIADKNDACMSIPGIKTSDPKTNGCPGDTDGDGIRDDKDACPNEKGAVDKDPKQNGCPKAVRVTDGEIIILQQVQFDTSKATIRKVSDQLLDEVAGVLKEHPEITRIEIQGHTDDRGKPKDNEKLSQDRADAVMAAMVKRGIEAGRMTAKGFGQNVPVADNKTTDGRQKNRRVQFKILEKKKK